MNNSVRNPQTAVALLDDPRWAAVVARDVEADDHFVYAVASTGVYCRPSCAARRARPENVRFYATRQEAENAGFRPCRRCRPDQPSRIARRAAQVTAACRIIDHAETAPKLTELAQRVGVSPYHFHRLFKKITGLTPREYAAARRAQRLRHELHQGERVTKAVFDAGYSSSSRFYEKSDAVLGMTPSDYRAGGANSTIHFALGSCFLGSVLVAQSDRGVCAILLGDDPKALARDLQCRFPRAKLIGGDGEFARRVTRVIDFIEEPAKGLAVPLDIRGTAFQQRVWRALRETPAGQTVSYGAIASRIGAPKSARAVARACAANPLAVAIPCHRAIREDGSLSGYRWGMERKRALLDKERGR